MTTIAPSSPAPVGTRRLLADTGADPADHAAHRARLGEVPRLDVATVIALVDAAGLTGRGGAGFPTARKIAAVAASSRRPVVVGNAMEGEFLSHKDAHLIVHAPHLVLDGLQILGESLDAARKVVAVGHGKDSRALHAAARGRRGLQVRDLDGGFVSGQESALVDQLNGERGVPHDPVVPVWRRGVAGRPTLVANAETLAQLALLARYGADWFRGMGTPEDPGTFLVTVTGSSGRVLPRARVLEAARGSRLSGVLAAAGVRTERVQAVLVGGYHGSWVPVAALDVPLSRAGLAPYGATPGAGVLHVLDRSHCPLRASAEIVSYLAGETTGQCGPCVNGLPRMADTLTRIAGRRPDPRLVHEVGRLRELVVGRGACAHPDGTARLVASTMRVFADHVEQHLAGRCSGQGGMNA